MQVYKAFFKIILKNLNQIMIYVVVFVSVAIALVNSNVSPGNSNFTETKINIAFINNERLAYYFNYMAYSLFSVLILGVCFNMENLAPIFLNMLIVIGFAAAVLSVTLVVIKQKRMSN